MENLNELKVKLLESIEVICQDYEVEYIKKFNQELKFKVPGWYVFEAGKSKEYYVIFYAREGDATSLYSKENKLWYSIKYCRSATPAEIEAHLRKICDEKGYKEGVKIKDMNTGNTRKLMNKNNWFFSDNNDAFLGSTLESEWGYNGNHSNPYIYKQGKFAEIILDKKLLPCSKDEAIKLIQEYTTYYRENATTDDSDGNCIPKRGNVFEFINEYED